MDVTDLCRHKEGLGNKSALLFPRERNHLCITFELLSINLYEFIKKLGTIHVDHTEHTSVRHVGRVCHCTLRFFVVLNRFAYSRTFQRWIPQPRQCRTFLHSRLHQLDMPSVLVICMSSAEIQRFQRKTGGLVLKNLLLCHH